MNRRLVLVIWLLAAVLALSATVQSVQAATDALIEAALKEGRVVWYTTTPQQAVNALREGFNTLYPEIQVEVFRANTFQVLERFYQEAALRRPTADLIAVTELTPFLDMRNRGMLLEYESPEYAAYINLPKDWADGRHWAPMRVMTMGIMINTNLIDPASVKTWEDILRPEFKGRIAAGDVVHSDNAYPFYFALRHQFGTGIWEKLAELDAHVFVSSDSATESVASGEWAAILDIWTYRAYEYGVLRGAPVRAIIPESGTVAIPNPIAITRFGQNPNAAKLFLDYVLSKEAQEVLMRTLGVNSGRNDVEPIEGIPSLNEITLYDVDFHRALEERDQWVAEWQRIMGR